MLDADALYDYTINAKKIKLSELNEWLNSDDPEVNAIAVNVLTLEKLYKKLYPEPIFSEYESYIIRFYEKCLIEDKGTEYILSRYETAQDIVLWFYAVPDNEPPNEQEFLIHIKEWMKNFYLRSDDDIRVAIINGALEHIFEQKRWQDFFLDWKDDSVLAIAYNSALEWGNAHLRNS